MMTILMKPMLLILHLLMTLCVDVHILPRTLGSWEISTQTAVSAHLQKEEKIYWGKNADEGTSPFQILLSYGDTGLCGGAIIDRWWLVTAAHCTVLQNEILDLGLFQVWAGKLHVLKESSNEQHRYIDMVFPHENYDDSSLSHDIALLHMKNPLILNENVSLISIADNRPSSGSQVLAFGYGLTENGGVATQLQYIEQNVPHRTDCLNIYGSLLDETMWCSGDTDMRKRAGLGDSGGPLIQIQDKLSKLVGLVSYSINDSDDKPSYDINCDVTKMKAWINEIMNKTWVELTVTKVPQTYSWSNKGLNYQTEFIKMNCNTGKHCRVQVKSLSINFGGSKHGKIKMFHDYDMTKSPVVELTPYTYSAVQAESGFASDTKQAMFVILLGQDATTFDLTFTYQVLDDSSCRAPSSQCDEVPDCLDLSDELGCTYPNRTAADMSENAVGCYPSDYHCPDVGQGVWCVRRTHVCNGYTDCVGGADETDEQCGAIAASSSFCALFFLGLLGLLPSS